MLHGITKITFLTLNGVMARKSSRFPDVLNVTLMMNANVPDAMRQSHISIKTMAPKDRFSVKYALRNSALLKADLHGRQLCAVPTV